jgi:AraC-like DNA-binding protein
MPTAQQVIVFNFFDTPMTTIHTEGQALSRSYVVGQMINACTKTLQGTLHLLLINLKPFAFNTLFKIPMNKFVDRVMDLESIIGKDGRYVTEQIFTASTIEQRIRILNDFLIKQFRKSDQPAANGIDHALQLINQYAGNISITDLAEKSYVTERTLRRYFEERVGVNPKLYSKLLRFGKVIGLIEKGVIKTWRDIPFDFGYFDQSHFIRDFKQFSGKTPTEYYPQNNPMHQLLDGY